MAPRPSTENTGLAVSNAVAEPPTRKSNSPDSAWGLLPVTGASRNSHPRAAAAVASSLTQATVSVLDSITKVPADAPAKAPSAPSQTSREAVSSETMLITTPEPIAASLGLDIVCSPERIRSDQMLCCFADANRVAQRAPEAVETNLHYVFIGQPNAFTKTQTIGAEKMHMNISWLAMLLEFEMMMFKILQAVAHFGFAGADLSGPQNLACTANADFARHR